MAQIKVVHGAPCSGKSTYVREHAGDNDIVWDYDSIRQALSLGESHSQGTDAQNDMTLKLRWMFAKNAADSSADVAWFICTTPKQSVKDVLGDTAEYIHMDATLEECLERLENDDTRPDKESMKRLIEAYFNSEGSGETRMSTKIQDRINSGIQYRNLKLDVHESDEGMIVEGYATTFNQPYQLYSDNNMVINEQVDARAFDEAQLSDVIFQYNHTGRVFARTRNDTLEITPDEKGLFIRADLSGTEEGRKLYEEIKGGYTDRMSFGFTVAEDRTDKTADDPRTYLRTITKIGRLFDVSAVSIPANDFTEISARSYVDGILDKEKADALAAEQRERQKQKIRILMEVNHGY